VAEFQGDRSRDLGESVAKKRKHLRLNISPSGTTVPVGLIIVVIIILIVIVTRAVLSPGNRAKPCNFGYVKSVRNFM